MFKHLVVYQGISIWRDQVQELWGKSANPNIKESRTYESDKNQKEFLEDRKDIGFMVGYGHMKIESMDATIAEGTAIASTATTPIETNVQQDDKSTTPVSDAPSDGKTAVASPQGTTISGK